MRASDARALRLKSLLLAGSSDRSPAEVVAWFGAMQAQDLTSGRWSLGVRTMPTTVTAIDEAIEAGEILRTWPMRGTIHFVPSADAKWMLQSAGARTLNGVQKRWDYLGLDRKAVDKAADVLAQNLEGGKRLLRSEAVAVITEAGLDAEGQRSYHFLWYASQIGVTCIGPSVGSEQTFVLLDEWAPNSRELDADAAYVEFARRFFRSHGPATIDDFARWVAIPKGVAKSSVAALGGYLSTVDVEGQQMYVATEVLDTPAGDSKGMLLLPGFDEFILGYKDRALVLADEHKNKIVPGGNGVFRSTIVEAGVVLGTWQRKQRAKQMDVTLEPFEALSARQLKAIDAKISEYGTFVEGKVARAI